MSNEKKNRVERDSSGLFGRLFSKKADDAVPAADADETLNKMIDEENQADAAQGLAGSGSDDWTAIGGSENTISDADFSDILEGILSADSVTEPAEQSSAEETTERDEMPISVDHANDDHDSNNGGDGNGAEELTGDVSQDAGGIGDVSSGALLQKIRSFRAAGEEAKRAREAAASAATDDTTEGAEAAENASSEVNASDVGANTDVFENYEYVANAESDRSAIVDTSDTDEKTEPTNADLGADIVTDETSEDNNDTATDGENEDETVGDLEPENGAGNNEAEAVPDEDDDLMVALGYDKGSGAAERVSRQNRRELTRRMGDWSTDLGGAFGYRGEEYRSRDQIDEIKKAYRGDKLLTILRAMGTVLLTLVIMVFEFFGKKFGGALNAADYPAVHILVSMQLLLITAALSWRQLGGGILGIFRFDVTPHSATAAAVAIVLIYDAALAIAAPDSFTLYNLPAALCILLSVAYDWLDVSRQERAFDALSSWESCCTLEPADPVMLAAALGGSSSAGREDAKISSAMRVRRGSFADGYFKRSNRRNPALRVLNYVIAPVAALALVVFLISLAAGRGFVPSANTFTVMVLIAMPVFTVTSLIYPFYDTTKNLLRPTEVLLGESDADAYASADAVIFNESDVFGPRSLVIKRIGLCGGAMAGDIFDIFEGAAAVFDKVGGALAGAFRRAADSGAVTGGDTAGNDAETVEIQRVCENGLVAKVGERSYLIGSDSFLTLNGIPVTADADDRAFAENGGSAVMFIAVDGTLALKMYISYVADDDMREPIVGLASRGIRPIMVSNDPNIDDALMARLLGDIACPVRVIRDASLIVSPSAEDDKNESFDETATEKDSDRLDAGLIADGTDWTALVSALPACAKLRRASALNVRISLGIITAGILLATFLGALGIFAGMHSAYIAIYQVICILPAVITSKLMLN